MNLKNKYFILRHGETTHQIKKGEFCYPWPEKPKIKLTKRGENQIKKAAKLLSKEKIDLIFASDIFRVKQSAKIIAKELGLKVKIDSRLRDINLGVFHNRLKKEFYQSLPRNLKEKFNYKPSKGESWKDCQKRMIDFLKEQERKYKGKTILIVGHGDPLWLLEGAVKNYSLKKLFEIKRKKKGYIRLGEIRKLN